MERLVYGVFKAIILSMIFVVVWQVGFYLYNVAVLDQRMSNLLVSMEKTVSENNYMPSEEAELYASILNQIQAQFDGRFSDGTRRTYKNSSTDTGFIADWSWNYNGVGNYVAFTPADSSWVNVGNFYDLSKPNSYGKVASINVTFTIRAPWVGFGHSNEIERTNGTENGATGNTAKQWHVETTNTNLAYTAYVPCLKYRKITN